MKEIYLTNRFFYFFGAIILLFALSFLLPFLFPVAQTVLVLALVVVLADWLLLTRSGVRLRGRRRLSKVMSLGDENPVYLDIENRSRLNLTLSVIDELPYQFQRRDFQQDLKLAPGQEQTIKYSLRPNQRGAYQFGDMLVFVCSFIRLIERRIRLKRAEEVPVYPSIIQMKNFELRAFDRISQHSGIKKMRRLGHSYEFEQIKNYVRGDDYRSINWKASSRRGQLMVNQYEDERAQQVYCVIDKSRSMKMPFAGLSLLDYAINTSLVLTNIILQKYDRAGLLTFSDKIGSTIKADRKANQLNKIISTLYNEQERHLEANYELLYYASRKLIAGRSLLLLFTNFESNYALERALPALRRINNIHLLVVIFFDNTEIRDFSRNTAQTTRDIYLQTVAQKFTLEKEQMVQKLKQFGIQAVLTAPEDLSLNTVNKYLELKSRGLI